MKIEQQYRSEVKNLNLKKEKDLEEKRNIIIKKKLCKFILSKKLQ